jgi:hypothetical protein
MSLARLPFADFWCLFGACLVWHLSTVFRAAELPPDPIQAFLPRRPSPSGFIPSLCQARTERLITREALEPAHCP